MRSAISTVCVLFVFASITAAQQVTTPPNRKEIEKRLSAQAVNGKTMFDWMTELKDPDPSIKLRAVATLKAYGSAAREATPQLLKALTDKDASTRVNACITLGMIGFDAKDQANGVAGIATLLNDVQGIVRYQAAVALSNFGSAANAAVPKLAALAVDKNSISWEIRAAACAALAMAGVLENTGIDAKAWLALLEALRDPCFEVRFAALQGLLYMGKPLTPGDIARENTALQSMFNDRHEVLAIWAHLCYMRINTVTEPQLKEISKHLRSSRPEARAEACKAIAIVGVDAKSRLNDVIQHIDDKDAVTAIWACAAVAQMKEAGLVALKKLKAVSESDKVDDGVKTAARDAIARLGGESKSSPAMTTKSPVNQKDTERRRSAQEFAAKSLNDWINDLRNSDPSIKLKAIASIKAYGEKARVGTPQLLSALKERDASTRINACITLAAIGVDEKYRADAVTRLISLLSDPQGTVSYQAATTLAGFGPLANAAVPKLADMTRNPITWEMRQVACTAIAYAGFNEKSALDPLAWSALVAALHDHCFEVRIAALKGLLYLGKPGTPADVAKESKALQELFTDKHELIAIWSQLCYMRINGVSEANLLGIAKFLKSQKPESRAEACKAFAIIGAEARGQTNDLGNLVNDKDPSTAVWACAAVAQMKEAGTVCIPKLKTVATSHPDEGVRRAATEAVARLGGDTKSK
jgi:HEAT repeat protein